MLNMIQSMNLSMWGVAVMDRREERVSCVKHDPKYESVNVGNSVSFGC